MLLKLGVCMTLVPLGIVCMKAFRFAFPSHAAIANSAKVTHGMLKYYMPSVAFTMSSFAYLWCSSGRALWMIAGAASWVVGMRLSGIGLTGGIGCGKTTVSNYVSRKEGWIVVDADKIAREVVARGTSGYRRIVSTFGESVVNKDTQELDRKALGEIVFTDRAKKRLLEQITHPRIVSIMIGRLIWHRLCRRKVLLDVPLMFESRSPILYLLCNEVLLIDTLPENQLKRVLSRSPELTRSDIESRINSQSSREYKRGRADYIFNNDSTITDLYAQLDNYFS